VRSPSGTLGQPPVGTPDRAVDNVSSTPASLVLGCATRLPPTLFEPFIRSLRATGYRGRLGLILGQFDEQEAKVLSELADFAVRVDGDYESLYQPAVRVLQAMRSTRRVRRAYPIAFAAVVRTTRRSTAWQSRQALEFQLEGLQALRYAHYRDIVMTAQPRPDQIFLTDVRDVFFQRDPFIPLVDGLELYLEDASLTLGAERRNRQWIRDLYGAQELAALSHYVVSCSGTVAGRCDEILTYLAAMSEELSRHRRPLGSHDQGAHNYLLRRRLLGSATIKENGHGRVLTMGGMATVHRDADGTVLNADGTVPAVLHQYDRHPSLATELIATLGLPR